MTGAMVSGMKIEETGDYRRADEPLPAYRHRVANPSRLGRQAVFSQD